ncbi:MAG TPA: tyrosine-type recombinase/integrase [Polyangiaceae bacterium]|jgi:integrase
MEVAHATGTLDLLPAAPTLRAFVEETFEPLYRTKFRAGTWKRYKALLRQGLLDELGSSRVDAINPQIVRAFMTICAKREIQARGPVNFLRTILSAAVETGYLGHMPELPKPPPPGRKLPSAPSMEEIEAMLGAARGWLKTAIAFAAFAGLRQGEVRALEVGDVDLKTGIITVRRALSEGELVAPKSGHDRVVPIAPRLAELIAPALRGKLPAAHIVVNRRGETPSRQAVWTRLNKLQTRHKLPLRSFHALRHFLLSALVRGGANLEAVRELAGHSKLVTTQRYVHATGADLRDAVARLG